MAVEQKLNKSRLEQLSEAQKKELIMRLRQVVAENGEATSETQLTAFVKYRDVTTKTSNDEIHSSLSTFLPEFMVPSQFTVVDAWPKTANGKIDRKALAKQGALQYDATHEAYYEEQSVENEDAQKLLKIWKDTLGNPNIGVQDNFFQVGGDSILAIQIISKSREAGISLTVNQLFAKPTIAQLVSSSSQQIRKIKAGRKEVSGAIGLTPIQHWFLEQNLDDPDWWNQSLLLEVRFKCKLGDMEKILNHLFRHHDSFRAKVSKAPVGWASFIDRGEDQFELDHLDLSETEQEEHEAIIIKLANTMHQSMKLNSGSLLKAAFIEFGDNQHSQLLLVAHHWAVDVVSWGIILDDLNTCARQYQQGTPLALPNKTTSIQAWADGLLFFSQSESVARELSFWEGQPYSECSDLPLDFNQKMLNNEGSTSIVQLNLSTEQTAKLKAQSIKQQYSLQKILLTAVTHALLDWTQQSAILVGQEGLGREERVDDVDLTRTVGWFTSYFPIVLELDPKVGIHVAVREISAQLDEIPGKGIGFGVLKYLSDHSGKLRDIPAPQIIFNYLGHIAGRNSEVTSFVPLDHQIGTARNPKSTRSSIFEINVLIRDNSLRLFWQYSEHLHAAKTIERLIEKVRGGLEEIIDNNNPGSGLGDFDLDEDDWNVIFEGD